MCMDNQYGTVNGLTHALMKIHNGPVELLATFKLLYRICQNIRGGRLSRFSWILAKCECFTIETFPASQLENNYRSQ